MFNSAFSLHTLDEDRLGFVSSSGFSSKDMWLIDIMLSWHDTTKGQIGMELDYRKKLNFAEILCLLLDWPHPPLPI